jgi:uncharacterized membrane protein YciS (DUF1049 family)
MVRWFFVALVVFIAILFVMKNQGLDPISIDYVFGKTEQITPVIALFYAFAAGFLTWFVVSLFNFLKLKAEIAAKNKVIHNLKQELSEYRNVALSDGTAPDKTLILSKKRDQPAPATGAEDGGE